MTKTGSFCHFNRSPEIILLAVMRYVRFPLSLRNAEDLLHEPGIDISHETVRFWWNKFGPLFAAEIRKKRVSQMRAYSNGQWHLDEVFVKINGETHYLWRAVNHDGDILESFVTKRRDCKAAFKLQQPRTQKPKRRQARVCRGSGAGNSITTGPNRTWRQRAAKARNEPTMTEAAFCAIFCYAVCSIKTSSLSRIEV
jgi:transposase-like protein